MNTFTIFLALIVIVCFLLVLVIMVQNPKGGGLSSSFGGSGSQQIGGVQKTGDFLDKSTWVLASLLVILILLSNVSLGNNASAPSLLESEENQTTAPVENLPSPTEDTQENN